MDYSMAALKLFSGELRNARPATSSTSSALSLFGILFQRAWLQGVLVSGCEEGRFVLDDGTDLIELTVSPEFQPQDWKLGMYVMVVGIYATAIAGELPVIKVHKIVDLSPFPDREAIWPLEVIEAHKLFYLPSLE